MKKEGCSLRRHPLEYTLRTDFPDLGGKKQICREIGRMSSKEEKICHSRKKTFPHPGGLKGVNIFAITKDQ
jgi:hypothetical protein